MHSSGYLLDVNILYALAAAKHVDHLTAMHWFDSISDRFGVCTLSETGFVRLAINPAVAPLTFTAFEATEFLHSLAALPRYCFWPLSVPWESLAAPFLSQIQGHNQITDALLLGLAVHEEGVLVTTDRRLRTLAGQRYKMNLLVIE